MAEWRIGRGWTEAELEDRLRRAAGLPLNFSLAQTEGTEPQPGWNHYFSEAVLTREPPGAPLPNGPFARAKVGIENYEFSDPEIVTAHFDPSVPLLGRRMLLEIKVWSLHFLCGVVVGAVRNEVRNGAATFGFRYDTLDGHIERGSEWFLLSKDLGSGEVRYRIEATWQPGQFPNWWSRLGFWLLAPLYQREWHFRAQRRLFLIARYGSLEPPMPERGRLVHEGPDVIFRVRRVRRS